MSYVSRQEQEVDKILRQCFTGIGGVVVKDIESFLKYSSQEKLLQLYDIYCEEVKTYNEKRSQIIQDNKKVKDDLLAFVRGHELVDRISLAHKITKKNDQLYAHWNKVVTDLQKYIPMHKSSPRNLEQQFEFKFIYNNCEQEIRYTRLNCLFQDITSYIKRINDTTRAANIMYAKALEYIEQNKLDISSCVTTGDYIALCNEHAQEVYRESVEGGEIDVTHGDGDDCTWEIGDRRCVCSNNRYYLEIEGDFVNGFYSYGQWC
jgi:hypothetical protein